MYVYISDLSSEVELRGMVRPLAGYRSHWTLGNQKVSLFIKGFALLSLVEIGLRVLKSKGRYALIEDLRPSEVH